MTDLIMTNCSVVRTTRERFIERIIAGGVAQWLEFERDVHWIQESGSQDFFVHGGRVLKDLSSYNDFYGYLSSCTEHDALERLAEEYGVTADSSLILICRSQVFQYPVIKTTQSRETNENGVLWGRTAYSEIPMSWRLPRAPGAAEDEPFRRLARVELGEDTTWSSKNTAEQNAALAEAFKAKWAIKVPAEMEAEAGSGRPMGAENLC